MGSIHDLGIVLKKLKSFIGSFFLRLGLRWGEDQIWVSSGYLAYVTLISLVPFATVVFGVLSFFPLFNQARDLLEKFIFSNFLPASGDVVQLYLLGFVANARQMTTIGLGFLVLTSILLISNIDSTINRIWRIKVQRSWTASFALYWLVLTLGPVFIGGSLAVTSYLLATPLANSQEVQGFLAEVLKVLPFFLSIFGFYFLYMVVPGTKVRMYHALGGAITAGSLFEAGKLVFSNFVARFPTYETLYGALAAIPLLFMWIYFSWFFVLIGAMTASILGELSQSKGVARVLTQYRIQKRTKSQIPLRRNKKKRGLAQPRS